MRFEVYARISVMVLTPPLLSVIMTLILKMEVSPKFRRSIFVIKLAQGDTKIGGPIFTIPNDHAVLHDSSEVGLNIVDITFNQ